MTEKYLRELLVERFGEAVTRKPWGTIRGSWPDEFLIHQRWVNSAGRFGKRLEAVRSYMHVNRKDLDGLCFTSALFSRSHFNWCNLRLVSFSKAELDRVVFEGCDLEGADFRGAKLNKVRFIDYVDFDRALFDQGIQPLNELSENMSIQPPSPLLVD